MPQVIQSMELAQVLAEAADIATSVNQKLTSAHQSFQRATGWHIYG